MPHPPRQRRRQFRHHKTATPCHHIILQWRKSTTLATLNLEVSPPTTNRIREPRYVLSGLSKKSAKTKAPRPNHADHRRPPEMSRSHLATMSALALSCTTIVIARAVRSGLKSVLRSRPCRIDQVHRMASDACHLHPFKPIYLWRRQPRTSLSEIRSWIV